MGVFVWFGGLFMLLELVGYVQMNILNIVFGFKGGYKIFFFVLLLFYCCVVEVSNKFVRIFKVGNCFWFVDFNLCNFEIDEMVCQFLVDCFDFRKFR